MGREISYLKSGNLAEETSHGRDAELGVAQQGIDLQPVAGAEDGSLQHLFVGPQLLQRSLHGLLRDTETFADLHRSRAMTQADDGDVHGG